MAWLYEALGTLLYWFSVVMGNNYALALVLYALVFKVIFLPFAIKQQKNQVKMANLTPKIELIKAKYRGRNDRVTIQKMQQEIMELQQREGVSMLGGCLPMLIQLPIIIFLYQVIRRPLDYISRVTNWDGLKARVYEVGGQEAFDKFSGYVAENGDQLKAASMLQSMPEIDITQYADRALPNLSIFGVDLGYCPNEAFDAGVLWVIVFIPFITAALQWLSMYLTKRWNGNANQLVAAEGQAQNYTLKFMDILFPGLTLIMAFQFTSLMGLYWIFQSILAIIQIFILSHAIPLPKFTEEQLKQMRREQKAAEKAQRAALKTQKFRSLHYIDEDDYDELPEAKTIEAKKGGASMLGGNDLPNIKD